jgi:hypothetical protein
LQLETDGRSIVLPLLLVLAGFVALLIAGLSALNWKSTPLSMLDLTGTAGWGLGAVFLGVLSSYDRAGPLVRLAAAAWTVPALALVIRIVTDS